MIWLVLALTFVATLVFSMSLGKAAAIGDRSMEVVDLEDVHGLRRGPSGTQAAPSASTALTDSKRSFEVKGFLR